MFIISDFSKTFTSANVSSTWSSFAKSGILGPGYTQDREALYQKYFSYEEQGNIKKTSEWFRLHLELFVKYGLTQNQIKTLVTNDKFYQERSGVREFLDNIKRRGYHITIVSSGITEVIIAWFEARSINIENIDIYANSLIFDDGGKCVGIRDCIRSPLDKYAGLDDIIDSTYFIMGDSKEDIPKGFRRMTFGFTDDTLSFSHSLGKNANIMRLQEYILI